MNLLSTPIERDGSALPLLDDVTVAVEEDGVDLYYFNMDCGGFSGDLVAEEQERCSRFATERLRHRYWQSRLGMRRILSRYLGAPPHSLRFSQGQFGKPSLVGENLRFNLSHSDAWAGLAVSRQPVGFDCEASCREIDWEGLSASIAHRGEQILNRLSFYRVWTRKEAVMKQMGMGFQLDPRSFAVSTSDTLVDVWSECAVQHRKSSMQIRDVRAPDGLVASLATDSVCAVRVFNFRDGVFG